MRTIGTKASLERRQRLLREREIAQTRALEGSPDDDPQAHGLRDTESRYADEDDEDVQPLDKLFR
jgi:hypothetical protein